ncbi:MAG: LysE/ArgO family amino acid transporter [Paracoccaceae bacterium]|jgi:L-lysine exporter family protein LysE/ArgO|tara:strand:+ start:371 stop:970 length:600 start_codon:yes stop_codon:yes gene_type:complete
MGSEFIHGLLVGLAFIVAIGPQNAFVLKSGLLRQHIFTVCFICAASDAVLILSGIAGLDRLLIELPVLLDVFRYGGATFLLFYGFASARSAWKGGAALKAQGQQESYKNAVLICLALTWLNPHVYLDTVILLSSIALQSETPFLFGAGAMSGSFIFFFSLGYGARFLAPVFQNPQSWRILDLVICLIMWSIAVQLLFFS